MRNEKRHIIDLLHRKDVAPSGNAMKDINDTLYRLGLGNVELTVEIITDPATTAKHAQLLFSACSYMASLEATAQQHLLMRSLRLNPDTPENIRRTCEWYNQVHGVGGDS